MAAGLTHPKSTVHVADGFKFLDKYKNTFDVIITDSSDPDGPAESLFQKSYFQLLHDALREGGVITTQGCRSPFFSLGELEVSLGTAVCENAPSRGTLYREPAQALSRNSLLGTAEASAALPPALASGSPALHPATVQPS